jgi:hypothetical protein
MRGPLAVVVALAAASACSAPPAPAPAHHRPTAPVVPSGPPPQIAWTANATFAAPQLPAIARSGELAVVPAIDSDSGRGFPNLRLEVRDRADRLVETLVVMVSNDFEQLVPDGTHAGPELEARIAAANRRLADLHAAHDLVPMREYSANAEAPRSKPVEGAGLLVSYSDNHVLLVSRDGKRLAAPSRPGWHAPPGKRCPQCRPCEHRASLRSFYKAEGIDVIVVRIMYSGTDMCWEPGDQLGVVSW